MNYVFQLVRQENGQRSSEFFCTREKLAEVLQKEIEGVVGEDLVVVLGECDSDQADSEFRFSRAPLMSVETFVKNFGVKDNA